MFENKLFFGYASIEEFEKSENLQSLQNFKNFLATLSDDEVAKMSGYEDRLISALDRKDPASFNNYDFLVSVLDKVRTRTRAAKVYGNLGYEYHQKALGNFYREDSSVNDDALFSIWIFPQEVCNVHTYIDSNSILLNKVLDGLCKFINFITKETTLMEDFPVDEAEWVEMIKSHNVKYYAEGNYRRDFPKALVNILDTILLERPQGSFNDVIIGDIAWMLQTRKLDREIRYLCDKYNAYNIKYADIQYNILAAFNDPDKYSGDILEFVCYILEDIPTECINVLAEKPMILIEIFNAVRAITCDVHSPKTIRLRKCASLDICKTALERVKAQRQGVDDNALGYFDINDDAIESSSPIYTEAIDYLDRWSFDYISGEEIEVAVEASDEYADHDERKRNREKRDNLNEKRREVSEKLRKGSAKVYRGYKTYKDNEEKVDSQLAKITKTIAQKATGLETNKIRDEIVEGKKFSPIGILKRVLGTVAIFSASKLAGVIAVVTHFYLKGKVTNAERKKVCLELEAEIEMVNEKIEDARADGNRKAKYDLMRTKHNLEVALKKIRSRADKPNAAAAEAKKLIRNNNT